MYYNLIRNTLLNARTYSGQKACKDWIRRYRKDCIAIALSKLPYRKLKIKTILSAINDFKKGKYAAEAFKNRYQIYGQEKAVLNFIGLDEIAELDIHRILTSGQQPTAPEGSGLIRKLVDYSNGRVSLMAGCGVNENNIRQLAAESGASEFHFSAREKIKSAMRFSNPEVKMGSDSINEYTREITTAQRVKRTIDALTSL